MTTSPNHWDLHAERWRFIRPPLRPRDHDVKTFRELLEKHRAKLPPPRVLLMGVTPELVGLPLPEGSSLVAVEQNQSMIDHVWPEDSPHRVVHGDWNALPFDDGSFDVVLGDGCFTTLSGPSEYEEVCKNLTRVLTPGGLLVHRFFVRAPIPESVDEVFTELAEGRIRTVEVFKWRLAMSLIDNDKKVALKTIWDTVAERCGEDMKLLVDAGFHPRGIATLEHYRDVERIYSFPTITNLKAWMKGHFDLVEFRSPPYDLGDRCPITLWRRRGE